MMLKRPDAFTLVELLAVIIILGIILVLAVPRISDMIDKYRNKAYERQLDLILRAAEVYSILYEDEIEWEGDQAFIYLEDLQNKDLIASPLKNPKGGEFEPDRVVVTLTKSLNGVIEYAIKVEDAEEGEGEELEEPKEPEEPQLLASIIEDYMERKYLGTLNEAHFYVGPDPDNWIEFGTIDDTSVLWRIIKSNEEGIKIIYEGLRKADNSFPNEDGSIGKYVWGSFNQWESSSLKGVLNNWYSSLYKNPDHITHIEWCIKISDGITLEAFLADECTNKTANPTGVGLIRPSDYISTSEYKNCIGIGIAACGKQAGVSTNFLYKSEYIWWTHNGNSASASSIWSVYSAGGLATGFSSVACGVRPVLNLKFDILYDSGSGTISSPYTVK